MSPRRIIITGGTGFVGQHLLPALRAAHPAAELLTPDLDVTDAVAVAVSVAREKPDAVIHLAAIAASGVARQHPDRAWQVNLHGTLNVANAIMEHAPQAVLLFTGSAECYGASFRAGRALDETVPLAPQNLYGATKAASDLALGAMAADGLRVIRARPFNHTGPGQTDAFVVPAFAHQIARIAAGLQEPRMQVGSLEPERDFLDVRDVCRAYAACLSVDLPSGTIINLCSGQPRRIGDILQGLLDLAGVTAEIKTDSGRLRPVDIPRAVGDGSAAKRLLDWTPAIAWEQTLKDILEYWRIRVAA
jgi:GDP-4-dehydro-6-deoxy-D-mannose reductase